MDRRIMVFCLMVCCISLVSCTHKNEAIIDADGISVSTAAITKEEAKLTLDEVKSKYKCGEIGTITGTTKYGDHILIEYTKNNVNYFDWWNLTTGDRDLLPV